MSFKFCSRHASRGVGNDARGRLIEEPGPLRQGAAERSTDRRKPTKARRKTGVFGALWAPRDDGEAVTAKPGRHDKTLIADPGSSSGRGLPFPTRFRVFSRRCGAIFDSPATPLGGLGVRRLSQARSVRRGRRHRGKRRPSLRRVNGGSRGMGRGAWGRTAAGAVIRGIFFRLKEHPTSNSGLTQENAPYVVKPEMLQGRCA